MTDCERCGRRPIVSRLEIFNKARIGGDSGRMWQWNVCQKCKDALETFTWFDVKEV